MKTRRLTNIEARRTGQRLKWERKRDRRRCIVPSRRIDGHVGVFFCVMVVGKGDQRLSKFAEQLMANDPQQRPSLLEWHKWFVPSSNDIKMAEKGPDLGKT
jgi:hypothetical protein